MQPVPIDSAAAQWTLLVLTLLLIALMLSAAYRYVRRLSQRQTQDLTSKINDLLPQTQCGRCSFEGCLPYAAAIADGEAINKCPPGGAELIYRLGKLLHENPQGLDPRHGSFTPAQVAVIREDECIGCTKCIRACPVDAILGGPKLMHTVIEAECTGCDLCLEPCPVDCIDLLPLHEARQAPLQYGSTLSSGGVSC
jgi:electron transport complex protein RnfB